jgi:hypothetical protein
MRGLLAVFLALVTAGCGSYGGGRLSLVSTIEGGPPVPVEVLQRGVMARRCRFEWPTGRMPTVESVAAEAIFKVPGADALTNVELIASTYPFSLPLVLPDRHCIALTGDAVRVQQ